MKFAFFLGIFLTLYLYLQLHVGDKNTGANEYDFKNALDILHLAVQVIFCNTLFSTLIQTIVSLLALELSEVNEL